MQTQSQQHSAFSKWTLEYDPRQDVYRDKGEALDDAETDALADPHWVAQQMMISFAPAKYVAIDVYALCQAIDADEADIDELNIAELLALMSSGMAIRHGVRLVSAFSDRLRELLADELFNARTVRSGEINAVIEGRQ